MKQNLYYVANARIPTDRAHGIQIMKMCAAFAKNGFSVILVAPKRRNPITDNPFSFHGMPDSFRISFLFAADFIGSGKLWFMLETIMFSLSAFFFLVSRPRGIVYSRDELPALIATFTNHDVFWESHIGKHNHIVKVLIKHIKGLIVISEGLKDRYLSLGIPEEKIIIAHDGADAPSAIPVDRDSVRKRYGIPEDTFLVAYTGRITPEKGIYTLLDASRRFPKGCMLAVAGEGGDVALLRTKYPHVRFLGHLPPQESILLQRSSDLLVIPNSARDEVSRSFTSPMKLFEYFTSGVPILASDVPSIRAIAKNGEVLWFIPDDANGLANQVRKYYSNREQGASVAQKARAIAFHFSWRSRAQSLSVFIRKRGSIS